MGLKVNQKYTDSIYWYFCFVIIYFIKCVYARCADSDGSMSASGSAGPGFDPLRGSKFSFENFQPRGQVGQRCTFYNCQIVHHMPGLNCKPFRSMYVEKVYSTFDSDSSIGWGCYTWWPPSCFSRRAGYEAGTGSHLLPSFHHHPTHHNYITQTITHSHPNLNFLQYTIQKLVPHVMWSPQAVRELKIDHTQHHLSALCGTRSM